MKKCFLLLIIVTVLPACTTTIGLKSNLTPTRANLSISDQRPPEGKESDYSNFMYPIHFFGDKNFSPEPLAHFKGLLAAKLPDGDYKVEVQQFRIVDIFPKRFHGARVGALKGVLSSMGYNAYFTGESQDMVDDNVTCLTEGYINLHLFRKSVSIPYKLPFFSGLITQTSAFQAAVNDCLDHLAQDVANTIK